MITMIAEKKTMIRIIINAMMKRIIMTIRTSDHRAFVAFLRKKLVVMGITIVITITRTMPITITTKMAITITMLKLMIMMLIFDDAVDDNDNDDVDDEGDGSEDASFGLHFFSFDGY